MSKDGLLYFCKKCKNKRTKSWSTNNVERVRQHSAKRRALKQKAKIGPSDREVLKEQYTECVYCQTPLDDSNTHIDHIVPLSGGGHEAQYNLIPVCQPCNNSKWKVPVTEFLARLYIDKPDAELNALERIRAHVSEQAYLLELVDVS